MQRITEKDCEAVCARINRTVGIGEDVKLWNRVGEQNVCTPNMYHISYAYGGVSLHLSASDGHGVHDVFRCGHVPKRELYDRMQAYLDGLGAQHVIT